MIRINLLPVRAAKKKESQRFQLTVAGLITVLVLILSIGVYLMVSSEASTLATQVSDANKELEDLAKRIGVLSKIEDEKAVVKGKLDTIIKLEENKSNSIMLIKTISTSMPKSAWLSLVKDGGTSITIKGYAADEKNVADFMRNLQEHSKELGMIELIEATRSVEKETNAEVMNFEINITRPEVVTETKGKKKSGASGSAQPAPRP